ncbi:branched-chain amino acid ABC transporter permease [Sulfitobacter mediterraneus]|jgi:branched-chain amino acid transport system permease protein|uniref:branched-chain amino acid ABC transporter permease n=1 Tax=Sulfitobacter TaxID=60136 RepID=UPI0019315BE2|nr:MULTISPECIES: branched-chain amino acid ABC transporter permease [Sulfitobacter]MBM1633034.1 branched-chain amino acid ABC transporter permease [Sulfitobacter mediterraneus]MBM1640832.1 branched-chain amino acid ABC transporter permease [Sulfitobacter mediterraneus]MBM1644899.1 branched-chain amino acid ABC transporter permease [Sulfitobacter mediterraneus]MBM1648952.1 branched-chain amino acid ABC transporter permease [Sulfitobacter mediterraneus]MBM1652973.1 branched-chain amino acid ABC 
MLAQQLLNGLVVSGVYALFALGFTLVFGIQRILNLAHGAIFMTGAMVAYYVVAAGGPLWLAMILAILASGLLSVLVEFVCFRRLRKTGDEEFGGIISSIGAGLVISTIAQQVSNTQVLRFPFETFPVIIFKFWGLRVSALQLFMLLGALVLVIVLAYFVYRTSFGRRVRAVTDNERAALLMGINPNMIFMQTYFLAGALAGAAGVLVGLAFNSINFVMGEPYLMFGFAIIILGGLGSIPGALLASIIFGMVQTLTIAYLPSGLTDTIIFAALFLILLVRPHGLMGKEDAGNLRQRR